MSEKNLVQENRASVLEIDLDGLEVEEIEIFYQEGSLGMPEFAASTAKTCDPRLNACSCCTSC
ncbi:MAG TPA: hypothetical protein VFF31_19065 [Blastocatellia bacterium]|jgi:hypothetical protein|nr:hypothetical protein [Blastocatellia bacterium]